MKEKSKDIYKLKQILSVITCVAFALLLLFRILITITGIIHRNPAFFNTSSIMSKFDTFISIILFFLLSMILPDKIIKSNARYALMIVVFIGFSTENIFKNFYTFEKPEYASIYFEMNKDNSMLLYEEKNKTIFVNKEKELRYLYKINNNWKLSKDNFKQIHYYKDKDLTIEIFNHDKDYFVYITVNNDINPKIIIDNQKNEYEELKFLSNSSLSAKNRYGKIIQDIEQYMLIIDDKQITYDDIKK